MVRSLRSCKFFPCRKIGNIWGYEKIQNFIPQIEISLNFRSPKVHLSSSQCLESSNSDHWRDYFLLTTSYFLVHCFWTCVIIILAPTFKMTKTHHPSSTSNLRLEIGKSTGWRWVWLRRPGWTDLLARPCGQTLFFAYDFFCKFWNYICNQRP